MKKLISLLVNAILIIGTVFAAAYKVEAVDGRVSYSISQEDIEVGQILDENTLINIRPNSSITLMSLEKTEKRTYSKPNSRIKIIEVWVESKIGKTGLKKQMIARTNVAPPVESTRKGVATAASRASEAKEDIEWDE